ncbi:MAG: acyclic terpene utilization AtuA family protein [Chloroflexi bacterium]|nr:acyclic terpene utilization AtuA family protein [Chloroflexota bacterium]
MDEVKVLVGGGLMHGAGTDPEVFEMGLALDPDVIGADGGSSDPGPYYLGSGRAMTHKEGLKQSLATMIAGALHKGIPFLVGSAGIAGGRDHLRLYEGIIREIAREQGLHFRLALIDSEQDKEYVLRRLREGRTRPLGPVPPLTEEAVQRATHIVGMMGPEPYQQALAQGAQVVIAGRSSDSALFASVPLKQGYDPALSWHMAKTIECGAMIAEPMPGVTTGILGRVRRDSFQVEPTNPGGICNVLRVSSHTLYENSSPIHLYEPPGMLDTSQATYTQATPRAVKVTGSRFVPAPHYTIKLEGAELVGYRTVTIGATRDPDLIAQLDGFFATVEARVRPQAAAQGFNPEGFRLLFRAYGRDAVMGPWEPQRDHLPHEVCILAECIAPEQHTSSAIMNMVHGALLHTPYPGRLCSAGNMAFPYSPHDIDAGPVYRFNIWHLVEPDDPLEMFRIQTVNL